MQGPLSTSVTFIPALTKFYVGFLHVANAQTVAVARFNNMLPTKRQLPTLFTYIPAR